MFRSIICEEKYDVGQYHSKNLCSQT